MINSWYYRQKIAQGAGNHRLTYGLEDVCVFDDGKSFMDISGDGGFQTDYGTFEEQVKSFESYVGEVERRTKRLKDILETCQEFIENAK